MEFAVAAKALGLRPIHGAEIDLDDGRHLTLLVEDATGWSNLCRILTRAHAHTREKPGPPSQPHVPLEAILDHAEGLVCLSGCALRGVHDEPSLKRLLDAFGVERPADRAPAAVPPGRSRPQPATRAARRDGSGCRAWRPATCTPTRARARRSRTRSWRSACTRRSTPRSRSGAGTSVTCSPRRRRWRRASPSIRRRSRRPRGWPSACGSICAATSATAIRAPRTTRRCASSPSCAASACSDRYVGERAGLRDSAAARLEEELRIIETLGLPGFFLLHHDMLELAREVAVEVRGPGHRAGAPAARARPRLERLLDRLLPDRPLARRPDRQRAADRALPERGADRAAGHRPRLPARHPRGADPARPRALRARPLGAGGGLPDLPRPRRDPRARQGAGAAAGGDRASRARQRGVGRARGRQGHRGGVRSDAGSASAGTGAAAPPAAGPGSRGSPPRRTGCRATSASTRAG